ncbi:lactate utilization protein C [Paenibacillus nanensis]|uniref:Lactate utilization protein C n=1 Tax=Paenibacillus nanensis TaxID=393251 RepID=A0A3A1UNU2_9BACL|nr:LUD domain-containing protein [Paenibacillus nanensis]RIX50004.1 lactate utilization protein C [Paenibacillus nanensis]
MSSTEHEAFLRDLREKSLRQQEQFIGNIKQRLGRSGQGGEPPAHPFKGAPDFWQEFELKQDERVNLFMDNWKKAGGHAVQLRTMEEAKRFIVQLSKDLSAKQLLIQNQEELHAMELDRSLNGAEVSVWHQQQGLSVAAGADIGVVVVDYAAAYTGSIIVTSSPDKGRSVSLLPTVMIAIIPAERLYTRVGQVLAHFNGSIREQMPAGIHFISGPSRSADIENDLTIGVHGPGIVYALVVTNE